MNETPDWFLDAKFGIYAHWGPVSEAREGADRSAALRRAVVREIVKAVRLAIAREGDGGFYDDQFQSLGRFGAGGTSR